MLTQITLLLCLVARSVTGLDTTLLQVTDAFTAANIPEDLRLPFNPKALLEVTFPQASGPEVTLSAGVQLPRNATVGPPIFSIVGEDIGRGPFVAAAVDLDAPTPQDPTAAQIRHFLGGNFVFEAPRLPFLLVNSTPPISMFLQPTPPAGSDPHRYVFLLFNQPRDFNEQTLVTPSTSVVNFNISSFAAAVGLGDPIAGSFMLVGPDPST